MNFLFLMRITVKSCLHWTLFTDIQPEYAWHTYMANGEVMLNSDAKHPNTFNTQTMEDGNGAGVMVTMTMTMGDGDDIVDSSFKLLLLLLLCIMILWIICKFMARIQHYFKIDSRFILCFWINGNFQKLFAIIRNFLFHHSSFIVCIVCIRILFSFWLQVNIEHWATLYIEYCTHKPCTQERGPIFINNGCQVLSCHQW